MQLTEIGIMEKLYTLPMLADLLQISDRKLEMMLKNGEGPPFLRLGRLRRWEPQAVQEWLQKQRNARAVKPTENFEPD
jgi:excisionase family DNA binding protein